MWDMSVLRLVVLLGMGCDFLGEVGIEDVGDEGDIGSVF